MSRPATIHKTETTDVGEQTLFNGVRPVTLGEKLTAMTGHPMRPKRNPQAPAEILRYRPL